MASALFNRKARTIALTVEGEAWLPHVRHALDGLRDSTEAVFGAGHKRLTISASQSVIDLWLMPRLGQLQAVTGAELSIRTLVLGAHDAPLDDVIRIRYGTGDWPHPYQARLYAEELAPVAAPSLAERAGSLDHIAADCLRRGPPGLACLGSGLRHSDDTSATSAL